MKQENTEEEIQNNDEPEIYTGLMTKKKNLDIVPVCIMVLAIVAFFIIGVNVTYRDTFGSKTNYIYRVTDDGHVSLMDGAIYLFLMVVAFICYIMNLLPWAVGVETLATVLELWMVYMVISQETSDINVLFYPLALCVFASEFAIIWEIFITIRKRKGK